MLPETFVATSSCGVRGEQRYEGEMCRAVGGPDHGGHTRQEEDGPVRPIFGDDRRRRREGNSAGALDGKENALASGSVRHRRPGRDS